MKKVISILVLSSVMVGPVTNVYAITNQPNSTNEVQQKRISESGIIIPNLEEGKRLQVSKGSNLDMYGISLDRERCDLTNDMVSDFDNTKLGNQDVVIKTSLKSYILPITVIDGQAPTEIKSIKPQKEEVILPLCTLYKNRLIPKIDLYDANGRKVKTVEATEVSNYDEDKEGKQNVTIKYKGLETNFIFNFVATCTVIDPQRVPLNGFINFNAPIKTVDKNNHETIFCSQRLRDFFVEPEEYPWMKPIDTSKPGKQTITRYGLTLDIDVGELEKGTLSTEEKKIMSKNEEVGVWKLPFTSIREGGWVLDTNLEKGTKVDAYVFYNNEYSELGTYKVDKDNNALVEIDSVYEIEENLRIDLEDTYDSSEYASIYLVKSDVKAGYEKLDENINVPNLEEGKRLQVSKGSNLDMYGISLDRERCDLTNDMVSDFDNTKLGNQDVVIKTSLKSYILPITVIDGQAPTEIKSIKPQKEEVILPLCTLYKNRLIPKIDLYDANGRKVKTVEATEVSNYDEDKEGKQNVTIKYKGLETNFIFNFVATCTVIDPQRVPLNGFINFNAPIKTVDKNNHETIFCSQRLRDFFVEPEEYPWMKPIDTSKPGKQTITRYGLTLDIDVGELEKGTLSTEEKKIMSKNEEVGVWKLPFTSIREGGWVLDTNLEKGTKVDAYVFYNNEYVKLGTYKVDEDNNALVEIKTINMYAIEEYLGIYIEDIYDSSEYASIYLVKTEAISKDDKDSTIQKDDKNLSDGKTSSEDKDSTEGTASGSDTSKTTFGSDTSKTTSNSNDSKKASSHDKKETNSKLTSVKTEDKANAPLFGVAAIASIIGLYLSKKRR